jgi:hypothetical protein
LTLAWGRLASLPPLPCLAATPCPALCWRAIPIHPCWPATIPRQCRHTSPQESIRAASNGSSSIRGAWFLWLKACQERMLKACQVHMLPLAWGTMDQAMLPLPLLNAHGPCFPAHGSSHASPRLTLSNALAECSRLPRALPVLLVSPCLSRPPLACFALHVLCCLSCAACSSGFMRLGPLLLLYLPGCTPHASFPVRCPPAASLPAC